MYRTVLGFCCILSLSSCQVSNRDLGSDEPYTFFVTSKGEVRRIYYENKRGLPITEGDIILADSESALSKSERGAIRVSRNERVWKSGTVPYVLEEGFPNPNRIAMAFQKIEAASSVQFVERTNERDFVTFESVEDGCSSYVGRQGGSQIIQLSTDCSVGNVQHELLHALGLWHEQSREDRDKYIQILWDNIGEKHRHNFDQHLNDGDDFGEYDYDSIMHYGPLAFSKNGKPTLLKRDGSATQLGNRAQLSVGDKEALVALYPNR